MAKYSFSFEDSRVVIVNDATNKVDDKLELIEKVDHLSAFKTLTQGRKADAKASDVAISLLADVLSHPRLDGYKGQTPINEPVPNLLKSAVREIELEIFKPEFTANLVAKGQTQTQADMAWDKFKGDELNTGSYSNAKSHAVKMYAYMGQLPLAPNGKLLPLHAIKRMLETFMQSKETPENEGIAGKLVKLASDIDKRTEKTDLGDFVTAIAALKSMLATYEGLYREQVEHITQLHSDGVIAQASEAVTKAMAKPVEVPSIESIEAMHDNGQIDDVTYQIMMLEHHNIEIQFEEAPL